MRNHWERYYTGAELDAAQALGVDTVRIPIGYWIMDAPVGASSDSPEAYGISPEGFVTGGLIHLRHMLIELRRRGMKALLDLHAHPCNSACVSNGLACLGPLAFTPDEGATLYGDRIVNGIGDIPRCAGGFYKTSRMPTDGAKTWGDVGINSIRSLAKWVASQPAEVSGAVAALQLANEPALGPPGIFDDQINVFYKRALEAARAHLPATPLLMSFMHPLPRVINFLRDATARSEQLSGGGEAGSSGEKQAPPPPIIADHHYYLNWQSPETEPLGWPELHRRACVLEAEVGAHEVDEYGAHDTPVIIGEWSVATNHDREARDLDNPETAKQIQRLYQEQLDVFGRKPNVIGHFFWTLRMGSGWDPRPTDTHPRGRQVEGTSSSRSLKDYPFRIWSLLEMKRLGIATPLNRSYAGACAL
jgi:hypothetical protein